MSVRIESESFKAIPTEYKGVCYRSKSEAMFSVWMSRVFREDIHYQYEPEWSRVGDYVFDFSMSYIKSSDTSKVPFVRVHLIEYKPNKVTECYEQHFIKRCCDLHKKLEEIKLDVWFYLYEGSFWEPESSRSRYLTIENDVLVFAESRTPWLDVSHAEAIRSIRFDLKGGV